MVEIYTLNATIIIIIDAVNLTGKNMRIRHIKKKISSSKHEKGNALFLILIAVALFAALSYAVTQSGRGGGSIDKENVTLVAVQMINHANSMRSFINRSYALGFYDQVKFDTSAENIAGTVHLPNKTDTTGRTIGLFAPGQSGLSTYVPPLDVYEPTFQGAGTPAYAYVYNARIIENGTEDLGTSLGDEVIEVERLSTNVCSEINRNLYADPSIPTVSGALLDADVACYNKNGTFCTYSGLAQYTFTGPAEGCSTFGGVNTVFIMPVKIN